MAKDYARRTPVKHGLSPSTKLFILVSVMLVISVIVFVVYQHHRATVAAAQAAPVGAPVVAAKPSYIKEQKNKPMAAAAPKGRPPIRFEFYSMLSKPSAGVDQVQSPRPDVARVDTNSLAAPVPEMPGIYTLQLETFTQREPAEQLQARLVNYAVDSQVVLKRSTHGQFRYQVTVGPFVNFTKASLVQRELKGHGIPSLLRRDR